MTAISLLALCLSLKTTGIFAVEQPKGSLDVDVVIISHDFLLLSVC